MGMRLRHPSGKSMSVSRVLRVGEGDANGGEGLRGALFLTAIIILDGGEDLAETRWWGGSWNCLS